MATINLIGFVNYDEGGALVYNKKSPIKLFPYGGNLWYVRGSFKTSDVWNYHLVMQRWLNVTTRFSVTIRKQPLYGNIFDRTILWGTTIFYINFVFYVIEIFLKKGLQVVKTILWDNRTILWATALFYRYISEKWT